MQEQFAPIFLHVVTQKGKGLKPAEENPGEFHAVSSIRFKPPDRPGAVAQGFLLDGVRLHIGRDRRRWPELCAITAAMKYGTGLNFFKHRHKERFYDVGMAEEHAVSFAAGLASQGLLPTVAIYSTFFQRATTRLSTMSA